MVGDIMFENKKIFILGFARSGYEASKYLLKHNNKVLINDIKQEEYHDSDKIDELKSLGCEFIFGTHNVDLNGFDYFIKNPGVPIDHELVLRAKELGIPVINEVEMAYHLLPGDITIIGITGTNGKTTTTTLTYNILREAYKDRVHLVGNIGYPLTSIIDKVKSNDILVMEVSVQQSENIINFHPNIGLITNYSEAHVDFFKTYDNYKAVKAKMFYNQTEDDIAILNLDNDEVLDELKGVKSNKKYFSIKQKTDCYLDNNIIYYNNEEIMNINDIKIPGMHNVYNVMQAISIVKELHVHNDIIKKVVSNFIGVRHRLEFVREYKGVRFYNDTEATNIKCTQIALSSFNNPTIIILGGLERGQNFDDLTDYIKNVKTIIAIGSCRDRVVEFANKNNIPVYSYEYMKDSFNMIQEVMEDGDVVLLSPASASWDQYKECEVRGDEFCELVNNLE